MFYSSVRMLVRQLDTLGLVVVLWSAQHVCNSNVLLRPSRGTMGVVVTGTHAPWPLNVPDISAVVRICRRKHTGQQRSAQVPSVAHPPPWCNLYLSLRYKIRRHEPTPTHSEHKLDAP